MTIFLICMFLRYYCSLLFSSQCKYNMLIIKNYNIIVCWLNLGTGHSCQIKVLSNNNFKSATHRVVRPKSKSRYSYAFFYNLHGDKWVEPLQQFTKDIGEAPKYRGFRYKEYQELRMRNKTHPPSTPEDVIRITHYALNTS
jgi:hypothetical protein